jgi:hypothetical protein
VEGEAEVLRGEPLSLGGRGGSRGQGR